jgi:hypothetical protein
VYTGDTSSDGDDDDDASHTSWRCGRVHRLNNKDPNAPDPAPNWIRNMIQTAKE